MDSLPAEPQGKTKNTGVGSLSLLQGIFLTQELNQGLLHCRQILYHLSYQGSSEKEVISASKALVSADREMQAMSLYFSSHFFEHLWLP